MVLINSPVQVLAGRGAPEGMGRQASREMSRVWEGNWGVLKERVVNAESASGSQAPLLARPCQQSAAAFASPASLLSPALIQRSWVLINPRMVLVRQSSTKANS